MQPELILSDLGKWANGTISWQFHDKFEYNNKSRKYLTNMQNKEKTAS